MVHHTFYFKNREDYIREYSVRKYFDYAVLKTVYIKLKPNVSKDIIVIRSNLFDGTVNSEDKHGIAVPIYGSVHPINSEKFFDEYSEMSVRAKEKFNHKTSFKFYDLSSKIENPEELFEFVCIDVEFDVTEDDEEEEYIRKK
jgi:hypothetical protein